MFNKQYSDQQKAIIRPVIESFFIKGNPNFKYIQYDEAYYGYKPVSNGQDKPCQGKVVAETDDLFVVKTGRNDFVGIGKTIASYIPSIGEKVSITPYVRRYFDGSPLDRPAGGGGFLVLGSAVEIPVAKPSCYQLERIITILENEYAKDGSRRIAEMLVDAMAKDFQVVDPQPEEINVKNPSIRFNVCTGKFTGSVKLSHNINDDCYELEFRPCGRLNDPSTYQLASSEVGAYLSEWIDDGSWKIVKVETI